MNNSNIFTLCIPSYSLLFQSFSTFFDEGNMCYANSLLERRKYHMNHVHLNRKPVSRRLFQKGEIESATLFMLLYIGLDAGENNCSNHRYV